MKERAAGLPRNPLSRVPIMPKTSTPFDFLKPVAYDADAKDAFHRNARRQLKLLAAALGLPPAKFDLRSNKAGIAVSGEITLHADHPTGHGRGDSGMAKSTCYASGGYRALPLDVAEGLC
jgi:hypothetical protein